jgi:hypothetical protein
LDETPWRYLHHLGVTTITNLIEELFALLGKKIKPVLRLNRRNVIVEWAES